MNWLKEEARGLKMLKILGVIFLIDLAYNFLVVLLLNAFGLGLPSKGTDINQNVALIYWERITHALYEEMIFRLMPLAIAVEFALSLKKMIGVIIISAMIFGYAHGGLLCIFAQGVGGLLYSIAFLKCGGYQKKFAKALASATALHFLYNATLITIALYSSART